MLVSKSRYKTTIFFFDEKYKLHKCSWYHIRMNQNMIWSSSWGAKRFIFSSIFEAVPHGGSTKHRNDYLWASKVDQKEK